MSRNVRQRQHPPTPVKPLKRRGSDSSCPDLSDEGGYSAVEDISDSEDDDEEHVYAAEEEHIISNELQTSKSGSPRPLQDDDSDADEEEGEDEDIVQNEEVDDSDEDDHGKIEDEDDDIPDADSSADWEGILSDIDDGAAASQSASKYILDQDVANIERHVRFAGVPDSDTDSTTTDTTEEIDGFFPDIFVKQSSLDPAFRREIEHDPDESSNSGSFWDFHSSQEQFGYNSDGEDEAEQVMADEDTSTATPTASQVPTEFSTPISSGHVQDLDGYETDGDTTEEDIPEPPARKKQARRCHSEDVSSDSDTERPVRFRRGKPRVGRYNLDSSDQKPIAVVNPITRKMMIFTPQRLRRLDLSPESFNLDFFANPELMQSSPILSNSASLMMSAMFSSNTFGDFMNTQAVGPAEAFFSLPSDVIGRDESEDTGVDDDEDEEEKNLKLEDFITFNEDSSEDEDDQDEDVAGDEGPEEDEWDGLPEEVVDGPRRPRTGSAVSMTSDTTKVDDMHPLLTHFDNNSDTVGAFRRNQINQQLIFSDKASQESLAFSGPYYHGTLRGIKSGSLESVTAPITPVRRQKRNSHSAGINGLELNGQIAAIEMSPPQKRKASSPHGDAGFHKRYRSISDMEGLVL